MSAVYDMDQPLALAESILNHTFADKMLGLEALMMAGGPNGTPGLVRYGGEWRAVEKNDRLAVHGDRQLAANLSEAWYSTGQPKGTCVVLSLMVIRAYFACRIRNDPPKRPH
jgi:hypothetical protein